MASPFSSLRLLIPEFAKSYGFDLKLLEARLQMQWAEIVGTSLARHTRPDSIRFKKLHLIAENSAWHQQLIFLKPTLIEAVNGFASGAPITDILFRVGEIPRESTDDRDEDHDRGAASPEPAQWMWILAREWTATIHEPSLRERMTDVVAKGLLLTNQRHTP